MEITPVADGSLSLSSLIQVAINEMAVGRLDTAIAILQSIRDQLSVAGQ